MMIVKFVSLLFNTPPPHLEFNRIHNHVLVCFTLENCRVEFLINITAGSFCEFSIMERHLTAIHQQVGKQEAILTLLSKVWMSTCLWTVQTSDYLTFIDKHSPAEITGYAVLKLQNKFKKN